MSDREVARDKAAKLLKKRESVTSSYSATLPDNRRFKKQGSLSTISFIDEPHDDNSQQPIKLENSFRLKPEKKFPESTVHNIIKEVLENYLTEESYEPELAKQMTKTISEVIKARVKDMTIPRYKVICLVHIGQLNDQGMKMGSRCLWDQSFDTFSSYEFRNNSLFAIGMVYGVYYE